MTVKDTVFKLLDEARSRGEPLPSLRVLRSRVGAGSLTTISQAVKDWHLAKLVESGQMPKPFSAEQESVICRAVWETVLPMLVQRISEIQNQANRRIEVERTEAEQLLVVAQEELAEAEQKVAKENFWREQIERLKERNTELETRLAHADKEVFRVQREIQSLQEAGKQERQKLLEQTSRTHDLAERLLASLRDRGGHDAEPLSAVASASSH